MRNYSLCYNFKKDQKTFIAGILNWFERLSTKVKINKECLFEQVCGDYYYDGINFGVKDEIKKEIEFINYFVNLCNHYRAKMKTDKTNKNK